MMLSYWPANCYSFSWLIVILLAFKLVSDPFGQSSNQQTPLWVQDFRCSQQLQHQLQLHTMSPFTFRFLQFIFLCYQIKTNINHRPQTSSICGAVVFSKGCFWMPWTSLQLCGVLSNQWTDWLVLDPFRYQWVILVFSVVGKDSAARGLYIFTVYLL